MRAEVGLDLASQGAKPHREALLGALRPLNNQAFAVVVEVDQGESGVEAVVVLGYTAVADAVEAELPFQHTEDMLDPGSYSGLGPVLLPV